MTEHSAIEVIYNGQCPICSAEIAHYRKHAEAERVPVHFTDLNGADLTQFGLDPAQAAKRLHVRRGDEMSSGVEAFVLLWSYLPKYRWLAKQADRAMIKPVISVIYNRVLAPWLYRRHLRRQAISSR